MPAKKTRDPSNPILNSPYEGPELHYATDGSGNLNYDDVRDGRRIFTPDTPTIPLAQTQSGMFDINELATEWDNADDEKSAELAFNRAQESSLRRFWKETENDDL